MQSIEKYVDHTLLKADATREAIKRVCDEAKEHGFMSVCVNSCHCAFVANELRGTPVKTCCVVGFPLGAMMTEAKAYEAACCVAHGADEVDMVINIGAAKDGDWQLVEDDIKAVVVAAHNEDGMRHALVKVIIETCLLTDEEKIKACEAARRAGADFVKTSTGFSTGGATPEDAERMIEAGASRLGTSNGVKLLG